jgi:hypothetical protein
MTRKTPSRTKRELEKLRRGRDDDEDDAPREVVVGLGGVPAHGLDEDDRRPTSAATTFEAFRVDLETGEVETPETPDSDDLPECAAPDCPNPSMPFEGESVCEKCADMPRRDWRPVVRENERGGGTGDDYE